MIERMLSLVMTRCWINRIRSSAKPVTVVWIMLWGTCCCSIRMVPIETKVKGIFIATTDEIALMMINGIVK